MSAGRSQCWIGFPAAWAATGVHVLLPFASALAYWSFVVVHAPNHRAFKRTSHLAEACRELGGQGDQVQLRLLERVPNSEVRRAMAEANNVADQFILGFPA